MGLLDAPPIDYKGQSLAVFKALRDLPNVLGRWRADELTGADGTPIAVWPDSTGQGIDMVQPTAAARPTVKAAGPNGHKSASFPAGAYMYYGAGFTNGGWQKRNAALAQPVTCIVVAKMSTPVGGLRTLIGDGVQLISESGTGNVRLAAGAAASFNFGPPTTDNQYHVFVGAAGVGSNTLAVDGIVHGTGATQGQGTGALANPTLGAGTYLGANTMGPGEIVDAIWVADYLLPEQWFPIVAALAKTYGITLPVKNQSSIVQYQEITDPGTSQVSRVWLPRNVSPTTPLYIWNHQQSGTRAIAPGYFAYSPVHLASTKGCIVVASDNGGVDGWDGATAVNVVQRIQSYIVPAAVPGWTAAAAKTILHGISMGGCLSAYLAAAGTLTNLKGVILEDAAVNLAWMYQHAYAGSIATGLGLTAGTLSAATTVGATSVTSTVSIPSGTAITLDPANGTNQENVTTTGAPTGTGPYTIPVPALTKAHASGVVISDYPTKAAGRDPVLMSAASWPNIRVMVLASTGDTTVDSTANSGQLITLLGGATLKELTSQIGATGGHLSQTTMDLAKISTFIDRSLADA
jgi:hypothetical protein